MVTLAEAIGNFKSKLINESWHTIMRGGTVDNLKRIIDEVTFPSELAKGAFKGEILDRSWHEVMERGTLTNLNKISDEFVRDYS